MKKQTEYRALPKAEMVFQNTEYGVAYAWKIEAHGLFILENTQHKANVSFLNAYEFEYNKPFSCGL